MKNRIHWDEMRKIAIAHTLEEPADNVDALLRFLRFWWCKTYNKPFKDPMVLSYTPDELCYEYLRYFYAHPDNDPRKQAQEEARKGDDEAWIAKMLAQVAGAETKKPAPKAEEPKPAPQAPETPELPPMPDLSARFDLPPD